MTVDGSLQDPISGSGRRSGFQNQVGDLENLFEIDGDGDKVEFGSVLERGRLPPGPGGAVHGRIDGVRLVRLAGVAHAAFQVRAETEIEQYFPSRRFESLFEPAADSIGIGGCTGQGAIDFTLVGAAGGVHKDIGALGQVEHAREQTDRRCKAVS